MQTKIDRRGFFASIGAALLAPLATMVPLKQKWVFNRSRAASMLLKADGWAMSTMPLSVPVPSVALNLNQYDSDSDTHISGLVKTDDPFQTFQVDTNHV